MTTHEVLVAARNFLDRNHWRPWVGSRWPGEGYCIVGAISYTTHEAGVYEEQFSVAQAAVQEVLGERVTTWNDAPGRTKEEVLAAFDKAIAATAPEPYVHLEVPREVAA